MLLWEYQVIHLNIDEPVQSQSVQGPQSPPPAPSPLGASAEQLFSKSYLEHEFPRHYVHPPLPNPQQQQQQHPALQLQDFLNGYGDQGWSLVGIYPLGPLLMMFFRRRKISADSQSVPQALAPAHGPEFSELLGRLAALEARLAAPSELVKPFDGAVLSPEQRQRFVGFSSISSFQAATALGFRSAASLTSFAARRGYPLGLVKMGLVDLAAIYVGQGGSSFGARQGHRWVVVPAGNLDF